MSPETENTRAGLDCVWIELLLFIVERRPGGGGDNIIRPSIKSKRSQEIRVTETQIFLICMWVLRMCYIMVNPVV